MNKEIDKQVFNEHCARLDGYTYFEGVDGEQYMRHPDMDRAFVGWIYPNYYDDLNLLMPLAWELDIYLGKSIYHRPELKYCAGREDLCPKYSEDPIQAIREVLFEIKSK